MSNKFQVGDLVWCKLKGFPHWPARVANAEVEKQLREFRKKEGRAILFFGIELTYELVSEDKLSKFSFDSPNITYKGDNKHKKDFLAGLEKIKTQDQIADPPLELDDEDMDYESESRSTEELKDEAKESVIAEEKVEASETPQVVSNEVPDEANEEKRKLEGEESTTKRIKTDEVEAA